MTLFKDKYRVESIRLQNWDYSSPGYYFITIDTRNMNSLLGNIIDGTMRLSKMGKIAYKYWVDIPKHYGNVQLDEFVVMPNHVHGIINVEPCHGMALQKTPQTPQKSLRYNQFSKPISGSLSMIINQYKSSVTRWCKKNDFYCFGWQTRFYEQIIRNNFALNNIRRYIRQNPINWKSDRKNR
ncbi:MAG: transposase [Candidatus Saganbacteria bacterium]|nr:transposase [Candidatus Saganbacteria bacterium]